MNHPRLPRTLIVLLFILVAITFLVGTLRSFASAQAAVIFENADQTGPRSGYALAPTLTLTFNILTPTPTFTALPASLLPLATPVETSMPTPTPTLTPVPTNAPPAPLVSSTDMTGIVSLGILLVVVILVGITWGESRTRRKKERK